jgi:phosphoribosylanthranilate isomerase
MPALLLDANQPGQYGGTGTQVNIELAQIVNAEVQRLMLAGGLTPDNVALVIGKVQPWGVDVASGVESEPGKKDAGKVQAFVRAVRGA